MLNYIFSPEDRPTVKQIKEHPWYNGPVPTFDEVIEEISRRTTEAEEDNIQEDQEIPDFDGSIDLFNNQHVHRSLGDEEEDNIIRKVLPYIQTVFKKKTEFFSTFSADDLLQATLAFAMHLGKESELDNKEYKVTLKNNSEEDSCGLTIQILKVDEEKHCVEVTRIKGGKLEFLDTYRKIKGFFGGMVKASL